MRADTLALLKELDSPVYRWPGGNFVSGYDWQDGIGDRDRRPPRKNPAWLGVEHNDFGLDEFMVFCRELRTEPYIAVNSGLGGVDDGPSRKSSTPTAAADTPMGKLRAQNGHAEPYARQVLGHRQRDVRRLAAGPHAAGASTSRSTTSSPRPCGRSIRPIKLIAVGDAGRWSEGMLQQLRRPHGPDQRALLLPGAAGAAGPRAADPQRRAAQGRGPPPLPPGDRRR